MNIIFQIKLKKLFIEKGGDLGPATSKVRPTFLAYLGPNWAESSRLILT